MMPRPFPFLLACLLGFMGAGHPLRGQTGEWPSWYPFQLENCYFMGAGEERPPYLDCSLQDGAIGFIYGEHHVSLASPYGLTTSPKASVEMEPIPPGEFSFLAALKKRYGRYYCKSERAVLEYDPAARTWNEVLRTGKTFSEFEILPGGEILLVCAGLPERGSGAMPGLWMFLQRFQYDSLNFLEIYPRNGDQPEAAWKLPADLASVCRCVGGVPVFDRTVPLGETLLVVNSFLGVIYALDLPTLALSRLEVPWASLDRAFLGEAFGRLKDLGKPTGVVIIPREIFPFSLSFYPKSGHSASVLVRMNNHFSPGACAARQLEEQAKGNGFLAVGHEYTPAEIRAGEDTLLFELDLGKRRFRSSPFPLQVAPLSFHLVSSLWLDPSGNWAHLDLLNPFPFPEAVITCFGGLATCSCWPLAPSR